MIDRPAHHTDWLIILVIIIALFFLLARLYHSKKFYFFLSLPFNSGLREFEKEFNPYGGKDGFDLILSVNSYIIYAIGLFYIFNSKLSEWGDFFRLLFIIVLFFLVKNFLSLFVAWLFDLNDFVANSHNANLVYRIWSSIWVFPVFILVLFVPSFSDFGKWILSFFISAAYLLAFSVSIFRVWLLPIRKYYKIFYLCALEITPLFFLFYWLNGR